MDNSENAYSFLHSRRRLVLLDKYCQGLRKFLKRRQHQDWLLFQFFLGAVFDFGDAMIFAMCFPNVLGLYFLAPEIKKDLKNYFDRIKSGEIKQYEK